MRWTRPRDLRSRGGQHSAVSRRQLLHAGVPDHVIDHRVAKGLLVRAHPGVYRVASSPVTWHHRIVAAALATAPGSVASHRAAAYLHNLAGIEPRAEVTVPRARSPRPPGVVVHRVDAVPRADIEIRDVAAGPQRGRPGAAALAELLAARVRARRWTQSEFERRLLALLDRAGVPRPVPQFEVALPCGARAFLDFAWPDRRLGVEADSYKHHGSRRDWARDRRRNNSLVALGWRILQVTWDKMVERPDNVVALLVRALAA